MEKILVLDYQENFADDFSCFAYGKIFENKYNRKCCYENITKKRDIFEDKMKYFDLDYEYISSSRVSEIAKNSCVLDLNTYKSKNKIINAGIVNLPFFKIEDIDFIDEKIINSLKFKNLDFIYNFDILDNITSSNSIGLYISDKDIEDNLIDFEFIFNSTKRLNKYLKKPILYVFTKDRNLKLNSMVNYEIVSLDDWREEFYFLSSCKHKIILNNKNSYSMGFWASILNDKFYSYKTYKKDKKLKFIKHNWLAI